MRERQNHRHIARICEQLHQRDILRLAAGHVYRADGVALRIHLVDDVARLEGNGFKRDVVFAR